MDAQIIELRADDSKARPAIERTNDGLSAIERNVRQLATRARAYWDDFSAATVRAMRTARDSVTGFIREHRELLRDLAIVGIAVVKHEITFQKVATGYKLARLAINPYTTGLILAAEAVSILTLRQAKLIEMSARAAAQMRLSARDYQVLANAGALTGTGMDTLGSAVGAVRSNGAAFRSFGVQTDFGAYGSRSPLDVIGEAQARLSRIQDPFARERQRQELDLPDGLRSDFNESIQSAKLFGSVIGPEGAANLARFKRGADEIREGFLDAARAVGVFGKSLLTDAAEGFSILLFKAKDTFSEFREEFRKGGGAGGREGLELGKDRRSRVPGMRAILGIQDRLDPRGMLSRLSPGGLSKDELQDSLRVSDQQRRELDRRAEERNREQEREAEEAIRAQSRAAEILGGVRAKEGGELAQIRQKYEQYRLELGKTTQAITDLREAEEREVAAFISSAREAAFKSSRSSAAAQVEAGVPNFRAAQNLRDFERSQSLGSELLALQNQGDALALSPDGSLEARRDSQLRQLDTAGIGARSVQQKVAIEQQRLGIEIQFLQESSRMKAEQLKRDYEFEISALEVQYQYKFVSEEQFQAKKAALTRIQEINQGRLGGTTKEQIDAAREQSIQRQTSLYQQQAAIIRSSFESTIDALFSRTQTLGGAIMSILQAAFLTPLKQFAAEFLTLKTMGAGAGAAGRGASGTLGGFGGLLGLGGGGGSFGSVFTPGFNGGGGGGQYSTGGGLSRLGGLGGFAGLGSMFFNSGSISLGAGGATTAAGIGGLGGGLAGFATSPGGLLAGGLLAFDGLRRGGLLGLGESIGGGALTGAALGTMVFPGIGTALGAGIGAIAGGIAGLIRMNVKTATEKAIEKAKAVYGVTINKELAQTIVQQAKTMGGLDVAITSPQIRELIELYAMATGQRIGAGNSMRPVSLIQSNGQLYQQAQNINGQAYAFQSPFATYGGVATQAMPAAPATIQLDANATRELLEGRAVQAMRSQPTASQQASSAQLEWTRTAYAG